MGLLSGRVLGLQPRGHEFESQSQWAPIVSVSASARAREYEYEYEYELLAYILAPNKTKPLYEHDSVLRSKP